MIELTIITLVAIAAAVMMAIDRRMSARWQTRLGRLTYVDSLGCLSAGQRVWAWRKGLFDRAEIVLNCEEPSPDTIEPPWVRVDFDEGEGGAVELPRPLLRTDSERPGSLTAHEWHRLRRIAILKKYPEIKNITPLPKWVYPTMIFVVIILHLTVGVAIALLENSAAVGHWIVGLSVIGLAASIGAFCAYALQQLSHEVAHTPHRKIERLLVLLGDILVGTSGPSLYLYYFRSHINHHKHTGDKDDPDFLLHSFWAVLPKRVTGTRLGRFIWLSFVGLFSFEARLIAHFTGRFKQPGIYSLKNHKLVALVAMKYAFLLLAFLLGGVWCLIYFKLAAGFSMGAFGHPYAGFWLLQHLAAPRNNYQPTVSYGGSWLWNWLTLAELFHVEHHDFPWIPFNKIYLVRKTAPEFYRGLWVAPSVNRLTWDWISHTDGTPWMDVAGALNCLDVPANRDPTHRPAPAVEAVNSNITN